MYYPRGVISSLVTSFDENGRVNEAGIVKNIEFQRKAGVQGICVLGGTAEPMALAPDTREKLMNLAIDAAGGELDVVVGALVGNPDEVKRDIAAAQKAGAQACLVTATPFVRPSERDVETFFRELARLGMPLILFNTPSRSGYLMSTDLIARLNQDVDNIVGIKESSRDILLLGKIRSRCGHPFGVLQGVDSLFLTSLTMGGDGGILAAAAVVPEICLDIETALKEENLEKARSSYYQMMPLVDLMYEASHPAPLKVALEIRGLPAGKTKPPLYGLKKDHIDRLRKVCESLFEKIKTGG